MIVFGFRWRLYWQRRSIVDKTNTGRWCFLYLHENNNTITTWHRTIRIHKQCAGQLIDRKTDRHLFDVYKRTYSHKMVYNTMHMICVTVVFKRTEQKMKSKKDRKQEKRKETNRTHKHRRFKLFILTLNLLNLNCTLYFRSIWSSSTWTCHITSWVTCHLGCLKTWYVRV